MWFLHIIVYAIVGHVAVTAAQSGKETRKITLLASNLQHQNPLLEFRSSSGFSYTSNVSDGKPNPTFTFDVKFFESSSVFSVEFYDDIINKQLLGRCDGITADELAGRHDLSNSNGAFIFITDLTPPNPDTTTAPTTTERLTTPDSTTPTTTTSSERTPQRNGSTGIAKANVSVLILLCFFRFFY